MKLLNHALQNIIFLSVNFVGGPEHYRCGEDVYLFTFQSRLMAGLAQVCLKLLTASVSAEGMCGAGPSQRKAPRQFLLCPGKIRIS